MNCHHQDNIILENDKLRINFNKNGYATSILYKNQNILTNITGEPGDPDKDRCFYCDYHMDGKTCHMAVNQVKVIQNDNQLTHIVFIDNKSKLGIQYHIILKKHDSAIYSYVKAWNNTNHVLKVNELRTVYRFNQNLFNWSTNGVCFAKQPSSKEMLKGEKIQDETYRMRQGLVDSTSRIYSKYDYASYYKDTYFWGQAGNKIGIWLITPDKAYYGSGSLNQDLTVHYDGLILNYLFSEHFGKGLNTLPSNYKKMYGPWCVYLNDGSLKDVKERSKAERKEWPYTWIKDPDYPLQLNSVTGKIISKVSNKYELILISQFQKKKSIIEQQNSYTYYVETKVGESFTFKNVRPGKYFLYAFALDGNDLGEHLLKENILVNKKILDLGYISMPQKLKLIWQIGHPSHTTDGFKFSNQLRNYIWQELVPKNIVYYIGQDNVWYYLQNNKGKWQIKFELHDKPKKQLYLLLALAGATQKRMDQGNGVSITITINEKQIFFAKIENDRSAYRSALKSGRYHLIQIPISQTQLSLEKINTITITTDGYLMYDAIQLGEEYKNDETKE